MEVLADIPWSALTPTGALLFLTIYVARRIIDGNLLSRQVHDEIVDEIEADRDRWQEAAEELLKQNTKLLQAGELTVQAWTAIRDSQSGESQ